MKPKRFFVMSVFLLAAGVTSWAQTASNYIAQGRAYLAVSNLVAANLSFSNALALSPTDPTGNVFYAATRLLVLPSQPVGSNFLTRWGVPASGRNIYNWTARPAEDVYGVPLAPAGVDANEATSLLRTNILAVVIAAEANLATVTDTNFTLALTAQETASTAVTLDYGDIQLLRSMLQVSEYLIYNTYSWNLDVQLTALRSFYTNAQFSAGGLVTAYPALFTFATTNDLKTARAAFTNGAGDYFAASQFMRNRPPGETRLFNLDSADTEKEQKFRTTLTDLENSLNGVVTLEENAAFSVSMAPQFTGTHPPRSFFPQLHNQGFVVGTLPDVTFGGSVFGLAAENIEPFLARGLTPIPRIHTNVSVNGGSLQFAVDGLYGHGYVVQVSGDLSFWFDYGAFFALGSPYQYSDPTSYLYPLGFYRVEDRTQNMPLPPNDNFASRTPLTGLGINAYGYDANATIEPGEPGYGTASVWWTWTSPFTGQVVIDTAGSSGSQNLNVYTGSALGSLSLVNYDSPPPDISYTGYSFYATEGVPYQIRVFSFGQAGGIKLEIGIPPNVTLKSPLNGSVYSPGASVELNASASGIDANITQLQFRADGALVASTTNSSLDFIWTNLTSGAHSVEADATDSAGVTGTTYATLTVPPANDNFASRIVLTGTNAVVTGDNSGATKEPGEPNHDGYAGGKSVWYSWTAPLNGTVAISVSSTTVFYPILAVYTGTQVSGLSSVTSAVGFNYSTGLSFHATAGQTYQIAIDDYSDAGGPFTLTVAQ
jgi:hypothetical protein